MMHDGVLTTDPATLRQAARDVLVEVLSCRENHSDSGVGARIAGAAVVADDYLPSMATDEFLPCLSKGALERAARASDLAPGPRAKDTRAVIAERFKEETWVYPGARFALTPAELDKRPAVVTDDDRAGDEPADDDIGDEGGHEMATSHPSTATA